ncbi:MAG: YkvA family protein [Myxococcota bacterium]
MATKFKVTFELDEQDAAYFRSIYRKAKQNASRMDPSSIIKDARKLVDQVRKSKKAPHFVKDAIATLEDMTQIIEDESYKAPTAVKNQVLAGLAYFSNPEDLIPDHIPALGFLDDAIMVKFVEEEFKHELWGYRKFRGITAPSEQRPWTQVGGERLAKRTEAHRKKVRAQINERKARDAAKKKSAGGRSGRLLGW